MLRVYDAPHHHTRARVNSMTDCEVHAPMGKIGKVPAGNEVLVVAVFIFPVSLVTGILGFTDLSPYVKKTVHLASRGRPVFAGRPFALRPAPRRLRRAAAGAAFVAVAPAQFTRPVMRHGVPFFPKEIPSAARTPWPRC